jgi:hypothetical protein
MVEAKPKYIKGVFEVYGIVLKAATLRHRAKRHLNSLIVRHSGAWNCPVELCDVADHETLPPGEVVRTGVEVSRQPRVRAVPVCAFAICFDLSG